MRNLSAGSDDMGKIFFDFDLVGIIEGPYLPKTI